LDKNTLPATLFKTGQKMIPFPVQLFTEILPRLHNESQLRATLYTWYAIMSKGSGQRYVYLSQLLTDPVLLSWFTHLGGKNGIQRGLDQSCREGIFLQLQIGEDDKILAPNDESGARLITDMKSESVAHHNQSRDSSPETNYERTVVSNVVEKYENEIGMLTPVIADMIAIAEQMYPTTWILEALDIAAQSNARSWKYVAAILARWKNEGKNNDNEKTSRFSSRKSGREQNRYDSVIRKRADSDKS
jgi:DNA replication protein